MTTPTVQDSPFWRRFLALYLLALMGVLGLIPALLGTFSNLLTRPGVSTTMSPLTLALLSLIQPAILAAIATAIGVALTPRLGLRSHIVEAAAGVPNAWGGFRREVVPALIVAAVGVAVVLGFDAATQAWVPAPVNIPDGEQGRTLGLTITGVLYGGIVEEILLRWGLMTLLAWLLWRLFQRGQGVPRAWTMWTAIVVSALLFGAGHLPVAAGLYGGLTLPVVARIVSLNSVLGIGFGWLFWRYSLEAAMLSHASWHVITTLVTWVGQAIGRGNRP